MRQRFLRFFRFLSVLREGELALAGVTGKEHDRERAWKSEEWGERGESPYPVMGGFWPWQNVVSAQELLERARAG